MGFNNSRQFAHRSNLSVHKSSWGCKTASKNSPKWQNLAWQKMVSWHPSCNCHQDLCLYCCQRVCAVASLTKDDPLNWVSEDLPRGPTDYWGRWLLEWFVPKWIHQEYIAGDGVLPRLRHYWKAAHLRLDSTGNNCYKCKRWDKSGQRMMCKQMCNLQHEKWTKMKLH